MLEHIQLLIVDDHPMIVQGYIVTLENSGGLPNLRWDICHTLDEALRKLKRNVYNVVLLDINLKPSKDGRILDGEDLGGWIRSNHADTKIIVSTMHDDPIRINGIVKSIRPDAFLTKSEITPTLLVEVISKLIAGNQHFSPIVGRIIRNNHQYLRLDEFDKRLLYHISIGEKTKNLPKHIPFSLPTLERRKRNIKIAFGIPEGDDKELIAVARELGFL